MLATLTGVVLPVFGIVIAAFATARAVELPGWLHAGIQRAAFDVLVPLLLFGTLSQVALPETLPVSFFAAYYGATLLLYALVLAAAVRGLGAAPAAGNVAALCATYGNSVLLGIPLVLRAFGDAASLPLFGLVAVHSPLLFLVTSLVHELAGGGGSWQATLRTAVRRLVASPILAGIAAGLAVNVAGLPLPAWLAAVTGVAAQAALPVALVAMGIGLAGHRLRGALPAASVLVALKLLVHPLLVAGAMALTPAPPLWRAVATVMAALPSGINVYLFATRFAAGEAAVATAILASTLLSMATLTLLLGLVAS
jgi:hypothetical protein